MERKEAEKEANRLYRQQIADYKQNVKLELKAELARRRAKEEAREKYRQHVGIDARDAYDYFYKKPGKKHKSVIGSLRSEVRQMAKTIPRQTQPAIDVRQVMIRQQMERQQTKPKRRNFFAHGSELDVYGDEGLTFFDLDKRGGDGTGSLFGLPD